MKIQRKNTGHLYLPELREFCTEILGGEEAHRKNPDAAIIWNALRMGVALAQNGKVSKNDAGFLRKISQQRKPSVNKIKDHQIAQLINSITAEVKPHTDCQSIREIIATPVREFFKENDQK